MMILCLCLPEKPLAQLLQTSKQLLLCHLSITSHSSLADILQEDSFHLVDNKPEKRNKGVRRYQPNRFQQQRQRDAERRAEQEKDQRGQRKQQRKQQQQYQNYRDNQRVCTHCSGHRLFPVSRNSEAPTVPPRLRSKFSPPESCKLQLKEPLNIIKYHQLLPPGSCMLRQSVDNWLHLFNWID